MACFRVHDMQLMLRVEVHRCRCGEAIRDNFERCRIYIDAGDLLLEPDRAIEFSIWAKIKAVEPAHAFHDFARWVCARGIKLIKRVAKENLRGEEAAIICPGERVEAG